MAQDTPSVKLAFQQSGVKSSFRGAAVKDLRTAWVSGSNGAVIRTEDAGKTWSRVSIPAADELDFRDVQILPSGVVLLMSSGPGAKSRVYRSVDDGVTWSVCLTCDEDNGFFNAMSFWDQSNGILVGDPIDGRLDIRRTSDGGATWTMLRRESRPELLEGEYGFAASGTNLETHGERHAWVATGGSTARVFRSTDRGESWKVAESRVSSGKPSAGVFSIAVRDVKNTVAIGGDYKQPSDDQRNAAYSSDGGETWTTSDSRVPHKACVRWIAGRIWMAAGRTGIALSKDDGKSWEEVSDESFYTFDVSRETKTGWLAGADGRIAKFEISDQ